MRSQNIFNVSTYKDPSIISRTGVAKWSKAKFGPNGHHHPFHAYAPFCHFLNASWKLCYVRRFSTA
jgi:hypothetical protein